MYLFINFLKSGKAPVKAACERLGEEFPALMRHAIVLGIRVPGALRRLDDRLCGGQLHGYAMCLNHWLRFLPVPVILLNAEWFTDVERLRQRYRHDAATGYHPDCDCPARYIMAHEIAHFMYVRMERKEREKWANTYEYGKPSGYSTTPEESFCEAFAGSLSGLEGRHFELASALTSGLRR
ncbi:MAG TPA: hypothetical protein VGJ92_00230 [Methanocella sp.]|jgi:hypothetical protein